MRQELESALQIAKTLAPADLPVFLGDLEVVRATCLQRLTSTTAAEAPPDQSLDVEEAAARLGMSVDYLYRNWQKFRFARKEGGRLLFSSDGLNAHLRKAR